MRSETVIETAKRVIATEAAALGALSDAIDGSFVKAVELLLAVRGRVIITGIGKSGHIARKIAATLASTGTPALFVHPAEASHGDLGMITDLDVVVAISFSGEAPELADLVAYSRRFRIPLIGITGNASSALARQCDLTLLLPKAPEACSTGVVPTSSTSMSLALGDALAVSLMEHRSFTAENFREFHPGGKLGAELARVGDIMHSNPPLISKSSRMDDALVEMTKAGFGMIGVTDDNSRLCGIVTDGDLRRNLDGLLEKVVGEVMTRDPKTIAADRLAAEAVAIMQEQNITCLLVIDAKETTNVTGIIRIHDCMRAGVV